MCLQRLVTSVVLASCVVWGAANHAVSVAAEAHSGLRPNILLVLLDDAGFMDFGAYGSDTATPNIDRIAQSGVMFTRYYTTPQCGPSRAALMTGQSSHQVGMGSIAEVLNDEMRALPAYRLIWDEDQPTIASRLHAAGYQTFASGKWGIGRIGANLPNRFGFDRSLVLDSTGASNFSTKSYLPLYREMKWFEDGSLAELPSDFYSSRNIVDKMIEYVDKADPAKPFFGYLALQAIHIPLQVSREFIDRYDGVFDRGWDVMRQERLERAIALGLVPATTRLSNGYFADREWASLSNKEKAYWARVMQVNAGMMEAADFHLGRLLDYLDAKGALANTIVVVTSDNGPEWATLGKTSAPATRAFERIWMAVEGWDVDYDNLGQRGSLAAIGHEWASVSAAPFHLFKFNASEGGLRVPMVVAGPGVQTLGFVNGRAQVSDIVPTLLDFAGVEYEQGTFYGRSLEPILNGQTDAVYGVDDVFAFEVSGTAALYRGDWKLTCTPRPFGTGQWQLFDMASDPGETTDVSSENSEVFNELLAEYDAYASEVGLYEMPAGLSARSQLVRNSFTQSVKNYWYVLLGLISALVITLYGAFRLFRLAFNGVGR